jgi:SAM-dependent methyltransferase
MQRDKTSPNYKYLDSLPLHLDLFVSLWSSACLVVPAVERYDTLRPNQANVSRSMVALVASRRRASGSALGNLSPTLSHGILFAFGFVACLLLWWCTGSSSSTADYALLRMAADKPASSSSSSTSTTDLARTPRARTEGCAVSLLPLECAWSTDTVRTQLPSLRLYQRWIDGIPNARKAAWDEPHYNRLNSAYQEGDAALLATGIVKLNLPREIHVIPTGGEAYFRRSLRDADLVMDGLVRNGVAGGEPAAGEDWLDFGGSHGRLAQIMAAAYPATTWHVCDPIADTVAWAAARLPTLQFRVMESQQPPLAHYNDNQFTAVYALSIWSHYSAAAALAWLDEMHRILKPGGRLWFSTHGYQALNFAALEAAAVHGRRDSMMHDLYTQGHYYYPMFGSTGDWGVADGAQGSWWGYGAFTTEWLAAHVLNNPARGNWRLEYYGPGVNEKHQDVYVLSKGLVVMA